jgi:hypothetical protein
MVTGLLFVLPALLPSHGTARAYETLATVRAAVTPSIVNLGYIQPITDAVFGTPFTRVTDGVQLQHWTEHHRPGDGDMIRRMCHAQRPIGP